MYAKAQNNRGRIRFAGVASVLLILALLPIPHRSLVAEGLGSHQRQQAPGTIGNSLVILADTADAPGRESLDRFQALADQANRYYALNSYGQVRFDFAFVKPARAAHGRYWTRLPGTLSGYRDNPYGLGVMALQAALADASLPEILHLERVIVIFAVGDWDMGGESSLSACTVWLPDDHLVAMPNAGRNTRLHVSNLVLLPERATLGTWVHELGHTLPAHGVAERGYRRISDRYNYAQAGRAYGEVGYWDLMGTGGHWGSLEGSAPTHMSSYTKVAAGWLQHQPAELGRDYVLTALENQVLGDAVLILDDPLGDDPGSYYILEARDSATPFGAPESGVMLYHVACDRQAGHTVVGLIGPQSGDLVGQRHGCSYQRPTLHEASSLEGAREYIIAGGLRVRLLAESFDPYGATVRIERHSPEQ